MTMTDKIQITVEHFLPATDFLEDPSDTSREAKDLARKAAISEGPGWCMTEMNKELEGQGIRCVSGKFLEIDSDYIEDANVVCEMVLEGSEDVLRTYVESQMGWTDEDFEASRV